MVSKINTLFLIRKISFTFVFGLFFMMICFPYIGRSIKIPFLLGCLFFSALQYLQSNRIFIHKYILFLISLYLVKSFFGVTIGLINGNLGVIPYARVHVVWIILYSILITQIRTKLFPFLIKTMFYATCFIIVYDIYMVLHDFGFVGNLGLLSIYDDTGYKVGFRFFHGAPRLDIPNLNPLVFLYPFFFALLVKEFTVKNHNRIINKYLLLLLIIFFSLLILLSGRRILYLTIIETFVLLFIFTKFISSKNIRLKANKLLFRLFFFSSITLILILVYSAKDLGISLEGFVDHFSAAFDKSKESTRFVQSEMLIENYLKSPFWGHGAGMVIPNYSRSDNFPWAYELTYLSNLNQYGIIGFFVELSFYFGIIMLALKVIKEKNDFIMIGLLSGFLCFLVGNATNPFLTSYDFLWAIFLP